MDEEATEAEAQAHEQARPIGGNEADFEAVLVDGVLGFGLSFGNAIVLIYAAISHTSGSLPSALTLVGAAALAALLFKGVQLKTDAITALNPRVFFVCMHVICFVIAVVAVYARLPFVSAVAAAVALTDTLFLYGRFLSALARNALMLVVDSVFLYAGIMIMVLMNMPDLLAALILSATVLITIVVVLLFIKRKYQFGELVSAADSKQRSIKVKGNVYTLFIVGFMMSCLLFFDSNEFSFDQVAVALGLAFVGASLISLIIRRVSEQVIKDALRKGNALAAAIFLLPLALVPTEAKLVLLACYACFVVLQTLIILDAIVETVRFNLIAAMWLLGKECSVYFAGLATGGAAFTCFAWLFGDLDPALAILYLCIGVVIACSWVQIKVNYQIYPFAPIIEDEPGDDVDAQLERSGRRKDRWNQKIDAVAEEFHLSPREKEILPILLRGRDAKYIMDTFYISQSTAKTHIYNIYRKFGIHSRQELLDFIEDADYLDFVNSEEEDAIKAAEQSSSEAKQSDAQLV